MTGCFWFDDKLNSVACLWKTKTLYTIYKNSRRQHILWLPHLLVFVSALIHPNNGSATAEQKRNSKVIINNYRVYSIGQMYFSSQFNCVPVPHTATFWLSLRRQLRQHKCISSQLLLEPYFTKRTVIYFDLNFLLP